MKQNTEKRPKHKIVRNADSKCAYVTNSNGTSNNLLSYPPDSRQSQNAIYWRTGWSRCKEVVYNSK